MNSYEAKQERRRQRYEELAGKNQAESERRGAAARQISDMIPMGQPILIGHHSEKRHRRDLGRIDSNMRASIEADSKAAHYASKAASVGKAGISSDDPEAIGKLQDRLAELKGRQDYMRNFNRAHGAWKRHPDSPATQRLLACFSEAEQNRLKAYVPHYSWEPHPHAPFELQNNGANIRRIEKRLNDLEAAKGLAPADDKIGDGYKIVENVEENRVQVIFDTKPSADVRAVLKSHGFRWSPRNSAWQRHLNNAGRWAAKTVAETLK